MGITVLQGGEDVNFWCPDAPTARVYPYPEFDPEFWDEVSTLPTCCLSYSSGPRLLRQLSLSEECGELAPAELPEVLARMEGMRKELVEHAQQEQRTGSGAQRLQELRRWDAMYAVFKAGYEHHQRVCWG